MGFRYPSHWQELADLAFDPSLVDHDKHGFAALFTALQEDRDRYLEDYLDNLPVAGGSGKRFSTVVVAASNSLHHAAADADFVCTGTNDDVTIQNAIKSITGSVGEVLLLDGTYTFGTSGVISSTTCSLRGMGGEQNETLISLPAAYAANLNALSSFTRVSNLAFLFNPNNNGVTLLNQCAYVDHVTFNLGGAGTGLTAIKAASPGTNPSLIHSNIINGSTGWVGIQYDTNALVWGNYVNGCEVGIQGISTGAIQALVNSNVITSCHTNGILMRTGDLYCQVVGNNVRGCGVAANLTDSIVVAGTESNVQMNTVKKGTGVSTTPRYGISVVAGSTNSLVTNNDLKNSGSTASFNDAGVGTVTTAGNRL